MEIVINGSPRDVPEEISVDLVVALVSNARKGTAVAVNGDVVRRASWASTRLAAGDQVEVLTAVQGG